MQWATILYNFAIYGGICFTLFLLFLLLKDWQEVIAKRLLSAILIHFLILFIVYAQVNDFWEEAPVWLWALQVLLFTLGPLIYSYVRAIYETDFRFNAAFYRQFWPAFFLIIAEIIVLLIPASFWPRGEWLTPLLLLIPLFGLGLLWYYIYRSYQLLRTYRTLIKEAYAQMDALDLRWLTNWLRALIVLLLLDFVVGIALSSSAASRPYVSLNMLSYLGFMLYIGYQGLVQSTVFLPKYLLERTRPYNSNTSIEELVVSVVPPPASNPLFKDAGAIKQWTNKLQQTLQNQALYQDVTLSLRQLAEAVGLTDKQLSVLLNTHLQTNFYEYINQYRVAAFKRLVDEGKAKEFTLLALALECGFSSKSSFNRIFKQQTGITPSAYKKQ